MTKLALIAVLLSTSIAAAQPAEDPVAKARAMYAEGKRHYDVGNYVKAIDIWKQAYVASSAPMLLFNIAQAYRLSGDCPTALKMYASYEREAPNMSNRDELERAKTRCVREPTNANPPTEPLPAAKQPDVIVPPPATQAALLDEGTAPPTRPPPPVEPRDRSSLRTYGLVTAGVGGALAITSVVLAVRASSIAGELEDYRGEWTSEQAARDRAGHRARTFAIVTGIAGAVGIGVGGALYFTGRKREHAQLTVSVDRDHAEVQWFARF